MNVIFLTLFKIRDERQEDIYSSFLRELVSHGHDAYVISPVERREEERLKPLDIGRLHLRFAYIGNYFNVSRIEKGITTFFIGKQYKKVIKKELAGISFDLILYSTPPVTFADTIKYLKKNRTAISYLMLKDIWPQSLADLGCIKKSGWQGMIYKHFRRQEQKMYRVSDYIGCMSPAAARYLLKHNKCVKRDKVEICPNAINLGNVMHRHLLSETDRIEVREKYGIPIDKVVFVFGGNIGYGHDPDFLEACIKENENRGDTFILFVGKGIFFDRIHHAIEFGAIKNSKIIPYLPKPDYDRLLSACDVGMIVLDHRLTAPNYPSRLLSYLSEKKPVIIATETVSDVGPVAQKNGYGYWCKSTDAKKFVSLMDEYLDTDKRQKMGERGYMYMKEKFSTEVVYNTIMQHF